MIRVNPRICAPVSMTAGSLSALSMAPFNFWWLLFLTVPILYLCLNASQSRRNSFFTGWCFAFGYFVFGLYWIGNALLVTGNPFQWAWPLAVVGLPMFISLFWGAAALLMHQFLRLDTIAGWLGFCGLIALFEFLRGTLLTGFPWNLPGYTWTALLPVLQILKYTDIYVLSLLTLIWASSPVLICILPLKRALSVLLICGASFGLIYAYGVFALKTEAVKSQIHDNIQIKIIQPNIDQAEKWQRDKMSEHFERHLQLSFNTENSFKTTYIIWPETAFTYRYAEDPQAMREIRNVLRSYPGGALLLSGFLRYDRDAKTYGNSLIMIDSSGTISNIYDKHHLVPFGEYIPLGQWIPIRPIVEFSGFQSGPGPMTYATPQGLRYSPQVCYEIIFPYAGLTTSMTHARSDFIVNVTNDAWYGISPGPYQHFIKAQYRAAETATPLIRSANTGFSGLIDSTGAIRAQTQLYTNEALAVDLPKAYGYALPVQIKFFIFMLLLSICITPALYLGKPSQRSSI